MIDLGPKLRLMCKKGQEKSRDKNHIMHVWFSFRLEQIQWLDQFYGSQIILLFSLSSTSFMSNLFKNPYCFTLNG